MNPLPFALHRHADLGLTSLPSTRRFALFIHLFISHRQYGYFPNFNIKSFSYLVSKTYEGMLKHYRHATVLEPNFQCACPSLRTTMFQSSEQYRYLISSSIPVTLIPAAWL